MNGIPDWIRLQKALSLEAETGLTDLQGKQYRFSEFLCLCFGAPPPAGTPIPERRRWQELGAEFSGYGELTVAQRQRLITQTRQYLHNLRQILEAPTEPPPPKLPRTAPLSQQQSVRPAVSLGQSLSTLPEVGYRKSELLLERLRLRTVRDLLFYYPREHIDYGRQVNIANLKIGRAHV